MIHKLRQQYYNAYAHVTCISIHISSIYIYIYAIHLISSAALKGISIEVNGEVTKLELTYSNYIGWIWPHEFVEHASVFFLFFSPFFPKVFLNCLSQNRAVMLSYKKSIADTAELL